MDSGQVGSCTNCGAFAYAQELCDPCSKKEESEEVTIYKCPECKSNCSDIKGEACVHCHNEAHNDRKCFDNCRMCEQDRLKGDCDGH